MNRSANQEKGGIHVSEESTFVSNYGQNEQSQGLRSPYEYFPSQPSAPSHYASVSSNSLQARRKTYEQGMQMYYDTSIDAVSIIFTNIVMNTPSEVALGFAVCIHKMREVISPLGLERCAWYADIAGLVIGGEATSAWGQSLKACLEEMCIKTAGKYYLAVHYNSRAPQPSTEQLQEKLRRIQFMTSAALNGFQSNIFDTREEAIAFLMRMRNLVG